MGPAHFVIDDERRTTADGGQGDIVGRNAFLAFRLIMAVKTTEKNVKTTYALRSILIKRPLNCAHPPLTSCGSDPPFTSIVKS